MLFVKIIALNKSIKEHSFIFVLYIFIFAFHSCNNYTWCTHKDLPQDVGGTFLYTMDYLKTLVYSLFPLIETRFHENSKIILGHAFQVEFTNTSNLHKPRRKIMIIHFRSKCYIDKPWTHKAHHELDFKKSPFL
jgi:hypothetical protein